MPLDGPGGPTRLVGPHCYTVAMANWKEIESAAPDFADRVRGRFEAGTNKTLATPAS